MLIKLLLWRNWAQYSPPESPPLAHQDPSALRLPTSQFLSSRSLIPNSAFHSRRSASATFLPLHLGLLPSSPFPSRLGLPSFICCNFSSLHTFSCLHPVYLCTGHTGLYLPPLAGVSPPERLTIPSAALLICHPNGGTRGEKQQFAEGEAAAEGQGKVSGLPPSIKFQAVTGLIYAALLAQDQNSF